MAPVPSCNYALERLLKVSQKTPESATEQLHVCMCTVYMVVTMLLYCTAKSL